MPFLNKLVGRVSGFFGHAEKKRVFSNFVFLSILQGANYLIPWFTFPYLTRVLGPSYFGLVAIAASVIGFFVPLSDFGFGFTATREVSIHRADKGKIAEIFSSVIIIKSIMVAISAVLLTCIVLIVPTFRAEVLLFLFTFGIIIGNAFFPAWFYQGMEEMRYVTFLNIVAKVLFAALIFIFVKSSDDYLKVPLFQSLGSILAAIIGQVIACYRFGIRMILPPLRTITYHVRESLHIFLSSLLSTLYMTSAPLLLSFFASTTVVGYFQGANKIIEIIKTAMNPLSGALYPYLSHKAYHNREQFPPIIRKLTFWVGLVAMAVSIAVFLFADRIALIVLGPEYQSSTIILRILSINPFFVGVSTVWGSQTLLPLNKKKAFMVIIGLASVLCLILSLTVVPILKAEGMALALVVTEGAIALMMFVYLLKIRFPILGAFRSSRES